MKRPSSRSGSRRKMAFRRRTNVRRSGARKRAVWVNIPFGNVAFTESVGNQLLMVPEDWEASFTGLTNEHAVLRAVVGEVCFMQTAVGTAGGNWFWGIYLAGIGKPAPVFTTTGMSDVSWLRVGARSTASSVTGTLNQAGDIFTEKINVKAKRKLDTNTQISMVAQFANDAATPAGFFSGVLRFLVARD